VDVLGLDVGGANLKAAHTRGGARLRPFALWKDPVGLPGALRDLLRDWPPFDRLAVTMTGELCDCFESKRQGVHAILDAVAATAVAVPLRVWTTGGRFVDVAAARAAPLQAAAANWLALATWAGRHAPEGPALLVDVGSTTTDVVPLLDGRPVPAGRTDPERLRCGELVYFGVRRTPLCAVLFAEVAAELFATTLDACLVLGLLPEDPGDTGTADGRPATRAAAHARLARMLCADLETTTEQERRILAEHALAYLVHIIGSAVDNVPERLPGLPQTYVLAGSGEFLARMVLGRPMRPLGAARVVSVAELLGPDVSQAACAYAVAVLAAGVGGGP
jgi:probable H4MPT-linked C1 transfer pathway protein